jgi:hypothetical protein
MSGPSTRWNKPVQISLSKEGSHEVQGPFEALMHLTENWPAEKNLTFVKARSACRGALAGHKTIDEARIAFEAAAAEARKQFDKRRH